MARRPPLAERSPSPCPLPRGEGFTFEWFWVGASVTDEPAAGTLQQAGSVSGGTPQGAPEGEKAGLRAGSKRNESSISLFIIERHDLIMILCQELNRPVRCALKQLGQNG